MVRLREASVTVLLVGAIALLKLGLLDNTAAALLKPQPADDGHMSSSNPWANDYEAPAATSATTSSSVYYSGCNEARAAGAAPIYAGEPGYRSGMDGDGDGIACEPYRH